MPEKISALLVAAQGEPARTLTQALRAQSLRASHVRTYQEARKLLLKARPPHLLFTETALPDGTWADVLELARGAHAPVNVIVVSRLDDVGLYLETLERGAFDFVSSPYPASDLDHVVRCASADVLKRRKAQPAGNVA